MANSISPQWIRSVVAQYEGPLLGFIGSMVGPVLAQDVVQDTFIKLCAQEQADVESKIKSWLFTVARNRTIDLIRKNKRIELKEIVEETIEEAQLRPNQSEMMVAKEEHQHMINALHQLPDNQREVIALKFQDGMSYKDISKITGLSVSNVGYLIHVGVKAIRQVLADTDLGLPAGRPA
jgi:RNA polymerase sigma factor (sigma-70 family)